MSGPLDAFGMPIRRTSSAPRFAGDFTQLVHFLESVERLAQQNGLSDKQCIKYALKYSAPNQRELFQYYEECGVDHYTRLIVEKPATAEAPHEAPLMCDPLHSECAPEHLEAPAIAPKREKHDIILLPVVPEAPFVEIASPPVHIEAPIMRAPPPPISNPEQPLATPIAPHRKSSNIIFAPVVPVIPETPFVEIISPIVLIEVPIAHAPQEVQRPLNENTPLMVREDLKHPSLFSAPVQTRSAALEAHYATLFDQNMSRQTPLATDNFALFMFSAYRHYLALEALTKGYPFWSWCQLALDTVSMRRARAVCAPYHSSSINAFTENQPILTCLKSIVKNAPKRPKARMLHAPYHVVNHLSMHRIAFPWRAFNQERVVQEFIPPVTSPPAIAFEEDLDYLVGIDVGESEDEDTVTLSLHMPPWRALFAWQHRIFANIDKEDLARAPVGDKVEEFDEKEPSAPSAPPFAPSTASPEPRYHQPRHAFQALYPRFSQ
ncbi:hypothetical protein EV702DRAFT_1049461 [Suillus placidus]|uniref:Uncharacterized protein n=1 Tax=Suillus placidus TaxID=48579 RepID=A0A9P6ZKG0_9AGAM|nr:hypothetical protein EV702DRAFT_1049458 [Suillus placidus]KAG1770138.1 hypothetical protein EV702DRAFT_1049461 [Suillus placidus]